MDRRGEIRRSFRRLVGSKEPGDLDIRVREAMAPSVVVVRPDDTMRSAARAMAEPGVGSAMVEPVEPGDGPGIVTARDILELVAAGGDPGTAQVGDNASAEARTVAPDASIESAAEAMASGGFRHLLVRHGDETVGIVSMRDVLGCWVREGATPNTIIPIREAMRGDLATLDSHRTLLDAARPMADEGLSAVLVEASGHRSYPGIVTEREVASCVAGGDDPAAERLEDRLASRMTFSAPEWSLRQAAEAMIKGGFQDVVVVEPRGPIGILAMRDIVRSWLEQTSESGS